MDTRQFVYNASAAFALALAGSAPDGPLDPAWREVLPRTPLQPDTAHWFRLDGEPARYARLDAFPVGRGGRRGLGRGDRFAVRTDPPAVRRLRITTGAESTYSAIQGL